MNTVSKTLLTLILASVAGVSQAAISYGATTLNQPYVGVKVGQYDVENYAKKGFSYGIYGGYNFDRNFGVEAEYQSSRPTVFENEVNNAKFNTEYQVKSYGAYGTYRFHFVDMPFYAKAKLGVARTEFDAKSTGVLSGFIQPVSTHKTKPSGGLGLGYAPTPNLNIEAGYNLTTADVKQVTVGAHFAF